MSPLLLVLNQFFKWETLSIDLDLCVVWCHICHSGCKWLEVRIAGPASHQSLLLPVSPEARAANQTKATFLASLRAWHFLSSYFLVWRSCVISANTGRYDMVHHSFYRANLAMCLYYGCLLVLALLSDRQWNGLARHWPQEALVPSKECLVAQLAQTIIPHQ